MQRKHRSSRRRRRTCHNVHFNSMPSIVQNSQRHLRFRSQVSSKTSSQSPSFASTPTDYYDIDCLISYGDSEQVEVCFSPGSYNSRTFSSNRQYRLLSNRSIKCPPNSCEMLMDFYNENDHGPYGDECDTVCVSEDSYEYIDYDDAMGDDEYYDEVFFPSSEREFCVRSPLLKPPHSYHSAAEEEISMKVDDAPEVQSVYLQDLDQSNGAPQSNEDWLDNFWDFVEDDGKFPSKNKIFKSSVLFVSVFGSNICFL